MYRTLTQSFRLVLGRFFSRESFWPAVSVEISLNWRQLFRCLWLPDSCVRVYAYCIPAYVRVTGHVWVLREFCVCVCICLCAYACVIYIYKFSSAELYVREHLRECARVLCARIRMMCICQVQVSVTKNSFKELMCFFFLSFFLLFFLVFFSLSFYLLWSFLSLTAFRVWTGH